MLRTLLTLGVLVALVGTLPLSGCQLVVDFDRDRIPADAGSDAGPADGGTNDAGTTDAD
jgi:hypothetical protein